MRRLLLVLLLGVAGAALIAWYRREVLREGDATVCLQSEHEHFHLHVDMPPGMEIQPGDTVEIISLPRLDGSETHGEITYPSKVRLYKASWLKRNVVKSSSLAEINELVEHP